MFDTGGIKAQVINIQNNQPIEGANVKLSDSTDQTIRTGSDGILNSTTYRRLTITF